MTPTLDEIKKQGRSLDSTDRDRLLRSLVADLDGPEEEGIERLRLEEARCRLEDLQADAVKGIPVDEEVRRTRARLEHRN